MQPKTDKMQGSTAPDSAAKGQVIACVVALGIMALGAWNLLGQKAPYHPDGFDTEVSRGTADLKDVGTGKTLGTGN